MKGNAVLRKLYVFVAAGALLALAAGVSYAAIPSAGGLISACKAKDGNIKLIDKEAGQNCPADKQLVEWNKQGPAGQNGASGYETVFATSATDSSGDKTVFANCPAGKKAVGGGGGVYGPWINGGQQIINGVGLVQDHPFNDTGWVSTAEEFVSTGNAWYLFVKVICADVS